jgi:hypothetical protein
VQDTADVLLFGDEDTSVLHVLISDKKAIQKVVDESKAKLANNCNEEAEMKARIDLGEKLLKHLKEHTSGFMVSAEC